VEAVRRGSDLLESTAILRSAAAPPDAYHLATRDVERDQTRRNLNAVTAMLQFLAGAAVTAGMADNASFMARNRPRQWCVMETATIRVAPVGKYNGDALCDVNRRDLVASVNCYAAINQLVLLC